MFTSTRRVLGLVLVVSGIAASSVSGVAASGATAPATEPSATTIELAGFRGGRGGRFGGFGDDSANLFDPFGMFGDGRGTTTKVANVRRDVLGSLARWDGTGVDIALIDSGVTLVPGLAADHVVFGPDLSAEGADAALSGGDSYGHGTHLAGIMIGTDKMVRGIAPGARIVSVKVAGREGGVDMVQVLAGIDWVVEHRNDAGLNIRVLNLSLGAGGVSSHVGDLLSAAVERAWDAGIVVVVAAGNRGTDEGHLDTPALDPYPIAVGATGQSSNLWSFVDDVADFSSRATGGARNPDVVAPGTSMLSFAAPGSVAATEHADALVKGRYIPASGTSQAAAVVSGTVAVLLSRFPKLSPDQAKWVLHDSASDLVPGKGDDGEGSVRINLISTMLVRNVAATWQHHAKAAEGIDTSQANWSGGTWNGATWSGGTWSGATWSGATWSGATWSGATWSGATWSGATWSGATWSGATWSGGTWSSVGAG